MIHTGRQIQIQDVKPAEKDRGKDAHERPPDRKDDECDRQPAAVTKRII